MKFPREEFDHRSEGSAWEAEGRPADQERKPEKTGKKVTDLLKLRRKDKR